MTPPVPTEIVHLDLARGMEAIPDDGVPRLLVFWSGAVPLAHIESDGTLSRPVILEALADRLSEAVAPRLFPDSLAAEPPRFGRARRHRAMQRPPIDPSALIASAPLLPAAVRADAAGAPPPRDLSVIVCTRDRPDSLRRCLDSLIRLDPPPGEIVVVDNSVEGSAASILAAIPDLRHVAEPRPGLSTARNAGIRASRSPYVAFTDDDVVVAGDWAARIVEPFADERVAAVTGLVLPMELRTPAQRAFQSEIGGLHHGYRPVTFDRAFFDEGRWKGAAVWQVGAGANMAFRRSVFETLGGFDERLGAGASGCSEDSELWYRILAAGGWCHYHPSAVVHHAHREDLAGLTAQAEGYMRGHLSALFVQFSRHRHPGDLRRALVTLPVYTARQALRARRRADSATAGSYLRGYLQGWRFARLARRAEPPPAVGVEDPSP